MKDREIAQKEARVLRERGYRHQARGELGTAIELYKRSIATYPSAQAYTYLGWAYAMLDQHEHAIELCKRAIEIDPDFGNPYNDIGAYLIELERWQEAVPWLEKAVSAKNYDAPQYAYLNLGRVYEQQGDYRRALAYYDQALAGAPLYMPAEWARSAMLAQLN